MSVFTPTTLKFHAIKLSGRRLQTVKIRGYDAVLMGNSIYQFRSWQTIHFEKMPIIFVKIVGTFNSANEV